jgi:hypothetical protein
MKGALELCLGLPKKEKPFCLFIEQKQGITLGIHLLTHSLLPQTTELGSTGMA